ncbi:MAG: class IV adenylate cyclase [Vicinamibacteria bacterium]
MAGPPIETEVKLRLPSAEAGRALLARLGARLEAARHLEDNRLFDDGQATLIRQGGVLRLRRARGRGVLTYKGPKRVEGGIRSREEVELEVSDPDAFERILAAMGFRPSFRYQKYREVYSYGEVEIVLDELPIGCFLEIEGEEAGIRAAASALGFSQADFVSESYVGLFFAEGGAGDMLFEDGGA